MSNDSGQTAKPPDMTWANARWGEQYNTARQQMQAATQWAQEHGVSLDEALKQIQGQTTQYGQDQMDFGQEQMRQYDEMYGPLRQAQANYALDYASPERKKLAMAEAGAGVSDAFKAAGDAANRNFERYGGDPSVGRGGALDLGVKLKQASAQAGAMDTARRQTEQMGQGLINQAIGTGQGVAQTGLAAGTAGVQAGATGLGEGINTYTAQAPYMGNALGWFGGGNQSMTGFVDTTQKSFQNEAQNAQVRNQAAAAENAGFGKLAGTALALGAAPFTGGMSMAAIPAMGAMGGFTPTHARGGTISPAGGAGQPGSAVPLSASPSRGAVEDDVEARVQPGEFIFPRDVMQWRGEQWAQKEIIKARKEMGSPDQKPAEPELKPALNLPPSYRSPGSMHGQAVPLGSA